MPSAPLPADEAARLEALNETSILDSASETAFEDLAFLASQICGVPVALVSLVDSHRQWFKARVGFEPQETSRDVSFCAHALERREPLVIDDATADPRFADNALVTGGPQIRFYAGVPLRLDPNTSAIGTLCVIDHVPRTLTEGQLASLSSIARQIARELRLRRSLNAARKKSDAAHPVGELSPSSARLLVPGDVISGGWRVERFLGQGGVGAVFEARNAKDARAAIKVILPAWQSNQAVVERFVREAQLLARVQSPHVVRLLDVGNLGEEQGALPYLVMEYLEGIDLGARVDTKGAMPWAEAAAVMVDACEGVAALHDIGAVHRDIKPANLFLTADGVVKVLDLGVATTADASEVSTLTVPGGLVGSMPYMAPEQILSSGVDARTDVWSLGVTLYESLTARQPFGGRTGVDVCASILMKPPLPLQNPGEPSEVPPALAALVRACLNRAPEARPASPRAVAALLRVILAASAPKA